MARKSKAEEIYNYIRDQILTGRWELGARLNDLEISEEVQVSRLSVREALFRLTETGIIEKTHWKGYFIKEIDEKTISNIIEIRIILETQAIKNLVIDATEADFAEMEQTINTSEELLNKNDLLNYLTHDYHFHELMYSRQHNSYITSTLNNYLIAIHFIRYISMGKEKDFIKTAKHSIHDHRSILDAIKSQNANLAEELLITHLSSHEQKAKEEFVILKPNQSI